MNKFRLILVALLFMIAATGFGQNQTSTLTIANEISTANTYQFDVLLTNTGTGTLSIANLTTRVNFNPAIRNGGTITHELLASDVPGWVTSVAGHPQFKIVVGATTALTYALMPALSNPGYNSSFKILPGATSLMYTVKLTNTVNWTASSLANCALSTSNPATKLSQYNATPPNTATSTVAATLASTLLNAPLNVPSGPIAQTVTGGGSFCSGTIPTGVSVGLADSEVGYDYDLYKDGAIVAGSTIAGTGLELAWTNLGIGLYTVKSGTTDMTGNKTVTETPVAETPTVSVVNNCDGTSTLEITNATGYTDFVWSGGLAATNQPTTTIAGPYTVTQSAVGYCTSSPSAPVTAAPKTTPATPVASVEDNCGNSRFFIDVVAAGATVTWYDGLNNLVYTGNDYIVNNQVTLTAKQEKDGCFSEASLIAVTSNPIPSVPVSVSIAADLNNVCAGTTVTFTATPVNGGTPTYQWRVNGSNVGAGLATYAYTAANGDVVTCVMFSDLGGCATGNPATSNAITMVVNPTVIPSVTINEANYACQGTQLTYTPVPVNGGAAPTYEWYVGANPQGAGATFTYTPSNGENVLCIMTSNAACVTSPLATSNIVNVFVQFPMAVSVSMNAIGGNTVCAGTEVHFTASGASGGAMPTYTYYVNDGIVQSGAMMSSYSYIPVNGDVVKCVFTSDMGCVSGNPATSSEITMIVNAPVEPTVAIVADANNICAGTTVTYTATPVNGGTAAYQWKVNGNPVGAGIATYAYAPVNGDVVTCVMTSDLGCVTSATATSNAVNMTINAPVTPSVAIAADVNNVCAGTTLTFTATPVNGGTPTYQWFVGGSDALVSSSTFASNLFANGDVVTCVMTSDLGCVTSATANSNAVNVTINAPVTPSVSIIADANNVCLGTTVTYTATPVNGGTAHYNWHINGNTQGNDSPTFAYTPTNGDVVSVIMTSDLACVSGNPATSNTVTTTVNTPAIPSVTISQSNNGNPICAGELVTYTATPTNGGTNPTYVWKVLSNPGISTGTTPTFTYAPAQGDLVSVEMTSDLDCVTPFPAVANSMTIIYNPGGAQVVTIAASANPSIQGQPVSYMATVTPAAAGQIFDWYVNTVWQNTAGVNTFSYVPANGDKITCAAVPTGCYTGGISNEITMTVNPTPNFTNTWLGSTTDWSNFQNWSLGSVPLANHDVIIPASPANGANFPIIGTPAVCHDITIQSGAQLIQNSTLAIGGKVYAQRLLTPATWHFVSSPINNATAYAFSNANPTNFGQNLFLQTYNEAWVAPIPFNPSASPWVDVIDGPGTIMSAGKGFEAWSTNNHIITMEGTQLNSANVVAPITYTGGASYAGFNLIGNPYPSAINITNFAAWGSNMDASMFLWNGFNYLAQNGNTNIGDFATIAPNQAFMVLANAGATFTIPAAAKTFGGSFMKSTVADVLKLKVSGNGYNDAAYINFNSNATANYDGQFDVVKIFGIDAAPQFYSTITNKNLSINTLPSLTSPVVVPMSLNVGANTTYTITASEMNSFANGTTITLEDTKTNTFTNLMQQAVYTFTASPADNANRFKLHFGVNGINENGNGNISIYSNSNVIYVNNNSNEVVKEIVVMNVLGQEILNKKAANTTVNTITMDVASAYYVVKVVTASKVYTEKVYVK